MSYVLNWFLDGGRAMLQVCDGIPISLKFYPQMHLKVTLDPMRAQGVVGETSQSHQSAYVHGVHVVVPGFIKDGEVCMFDLTDNFRPIYVSRFESKEKST